MKKKNLLFTTLCSAMFFAACSNEDAPLEGVTSKKQFTVNLTADFDLVASRVSGAPSENVLGKTRILLYSQAGDLLGSQLVDGIIGSQTIALTGDATSDQVKQVYVLTNVESSDPFKLELTTADDYSKSIVDASSIIVDNYTGLPDKPKLPFVGSTSNITNGQATVDISRRVARLIIKNDTKEGIDIEYNNLATKFSNFVPDSINQSPTEFAQFTSTTPMDKADTLYVLPNSAVNVANQTSIKVTYKGNSKSVTIPAVVGNNTYTYTVTSTESNNINVQGNPNTNWESGPNGDINIDTTTPTVPVIPTPTSVSDVYKGMTVDLPGLTTHEGLSVESSNFDVAFATVTRANVVTATVKPKNNPFAELTEVINVMKDGKVVAKINATNKFEYEEVNVGPITFMDRDLGAPAKGEPGDLFVAGWLKGLDQTNAPFSKKAAYSGNGRLQPLTTWTGFGSADKWFTNADGSKNESIDPCPAGWRVMTESDLLNILTPSRSVPSSTGVIGDMGRVSATATIDARSIKIVKTGDTAPFELIFSLETGQYDGGFKRLSNWPTAWYTSTKEGNKYVQFTIGLTSPNREIQIKANNDLAVGGARGYQIRCVKDHN